MSNHILQVLHIKLQNKLYCIPIEYIEKIMLLTYLTPIPNSPPYLIGMLNLYGESVSVIDLSLRLNMKHTQKYTVNTPLIICSFKNQKIGLIVDDALQLMDVKKNEIQLSQEFEKPGSFFLGSIQYNTEFSLLLNMKDLLTICLSEHEQS